MASTRKKQDEKNLKTLRELGALQQNKYCFDCNQRGPTYVNVTIGSLVCTKCSGMLRGLTPPHRVKSISMATFTSEEVDLLKNRGNAYCRKVWLGLYEGLPPSPSSDELAVKDFMVEKYERRRYYLEPSKADAIARPQATSGGGGGDAKSMARTNGHVAVNGTQMQNAHRTRPEVNRNNHKNGNGFAVDFDSAYIFNNAATNGNASTNSFANFDNNPAFSKSNTSTNSSTTITGMPTSTVFNNMNGWNSTHHTNGATLNGSMNSTPSVVPNNIPPAPTEDKYAALKDLDNEFKSQKGANSVDWGSSEGSLYSSPTPTGSAYSSSSPQSSIFGSPSQGQFMNAFPLSQENGTVSNPFNNGGMNWANGNGMQQSQQQTAFANPFRDTNKMNGFTQVFQPISPFPVNGMQVGVNGTNGWTPNPFKVGGASTNMNSNNPFL